MDTTPERNAEQAQIWNGPSGRVWVESQALLDHAFHPFEQLLADTAAALSPHRVLDIGCGTGATTLAVARRLGPGAHCLGLDISEPMLTLARARAEHEHSAVEFLHADAQTYPFEAASFDLILSRFGVMFFDDPVAAFTNLRRAVTPDGALRLLAWRSAVDNPFMTAAERAVAALLPNLPPRQSDGPGQFAFADATRVRSILEQSGWTGVDVAPLDIECGFPAPDLDAYLTRLGPVGRVLQDADESERAKLLAAIRPAFDAYVRGTEVRFTAACWMVTSG
jgi:ubiquinone/menaquinone biosynthesis C-methylase UbiE